MKALKTLIRLTKRQLDEKRRRLIELEHEKEQLELLLERLKAQFLKEQETAEQFPELMLTFLSYAEQNRFQQVNIGLAIEKTDKKREAIIDEIAELFAEQKRYEIALDNKLLQEARAREHMEVQRFNEIALTQYVRRQDEEDGVKN